MQKQIVGGDLLKVNRRGLVQVSAERREALLDEIEHRGGSATQFAAQVGVKYKTFATWRSNRNRRRSLAKVEPNVLPSAAPKESSDRGQWVEVVVEKQRGGIAAVEVERRGSDLRTGASLNLALPGGAHLEISDVSQMKLAVELLRALEEKGRVVC